ncbi:MAG: hypothetical protein ACKO1Y_06685 [Actinomycetota bacterium]
MSEAHEVQHEHWAYRLRPGRLRALRILEMSPPALRAQLAERRLRRPGQPGPAAEHVVQYQVSATLATRRAADRSDESEGTGSESARGKKPIVVGQADFFYRSQYRQTCTAVMGAFAATATQVLAASSTEPRGRLWGRHRESVTAMMPRHPGHSTRPILVLTDRAVAVAVLVPRTGDSAADQATTAWLHGSGPMPPHLDTERRGSETAAMPGIKNSRSRSHLGSVVALVDAARRTGWLALLALHQTDPDAMGLHLTLHGVECVSPEQLARDYALTDTDLAAHRSQAESEDAILGYLVGGTAEVFTQCSQNLFVKEAVVNSPDRTADPATDPATDPDASDPIPLTDLLAAQFETIQATVDATGLPGASPRNGQIGGAALVAERRGRAHVLIPYPPGNAIHGHAAKLWSNQHASLVITDDHTLRRRASITGRSWCASHERVARDFPDVARSVTHPDGSDEQTVADPVYWFVTRADVVTWEQGLLPAYRLTEGRAACTLNAGGEGRHTKKPKYFDAGSVPVYDVALQHHREAAGRPTDADGTARAAWLATVEPALAAREQHLA